MRKGVNKMIMTNGIVYQICIVAAFLSVFFWNSLALAETSYEMEKGLDVLAMQLIADRSAISEKKVAVTDLSPLFGDIGNLGAFLAEEIFTLLRQQHVKLLERKLLEDALVELRLNMTDLVDPENAKHFGKFTGTGLLLLGTVTDLPDTVKVNARLVDIESRVIVGAGSVELLKSKEVLKVMGIPAPGRIQIVSEAGSTVYLDGETVGQTDWRGRLRLDSVKPGGHTVIIRQEGYRPASLRFDLEEDSEVHVELSLHRYPSPATAATLSFLLPGAGDLYLGQRDWWIYPLAVGGSIYGAYAFSKKTDEMILVQDNQGSRIEKRGKAPVYAFAGLAAAIWLYDIFHVYSAAEKERYLQSNQNGLGLEIDPDSKRTILVYRWSW
jgi:TolB-like protein